MLLMSLSFRLIPLFSLNGFKYCYGQKFAIYYRYIVLWCNVMLEWLAWTVCLAACYLNINLFSGWRRSLSMRQMQEGIYESADFLGPQAESVHGRHCRLWQLDKLSFLEFAIFNGCWKYKCEHCLHNASGVCS